MFFHTEPAARGAIILKDRAPGADYAGGVFPAALVAARRKNFITIFWAPFVLTFVIQKGKSWRGPHKCFLYRLNVFFIQFAFKRHEKRVKNM
jgi:hypothetical protein